MKKSPLLASSNFVPPRIAPNRLTFQVSLPPPPLPPSLIACRDKEAAQVQQGHSFDLISFNKKKEEMALPVSSAWQLRGGSHWRCVREGGSPRSSIMGSS